MFLTVIETGPSSFGAFAPDIEGCIAFARSRDEARSLFKMAAASHLRELAANGDPLPEPLTKEIPGLAIGVPSGAITLEWTAVELPVARANRVEDPNG